MLIDGATGPELQRRGVRISGGDLSYNSVDYESIFAIGLVLFIMTLTLNIIARRVVSKYREVYE